MRLFRLLHSAQLSPRRDVSFFMRHPAALVLLFEQSKMRGELPIEIGVGAL
jgi:hypothetical protein